MCQNQPRQYRCAEPISGDGSAQPEQVLSGVGHHQRVRIGRPGVDIDGGRVQIVQVDRPGGLLRDAGRQSNGHPVAFPVDLNVLRALLGERPPEVETLRLLETNVDDVTGELLAHLITRLLATGAADAWLTPIVMKKGRPAHTVHVLVRPEHAAACEQVLLAETGSLGVRRSDVSRVALARHTDSVVVDGHPIRIKHGPWGAKPEHDDVAAAATALGLPLRVVAERARILASRG